ncbi:MAG TPA: hypothetical protein VFS39_00650 [Nitrospira sp.]|nr:hypothetical protein [Nitrospira sp.]
MGDQWSISQEEEETHRRSLFQKARKGDKKAQQELQTTYGVRLWSDHERARLVYDNPRYTRTRATGKKPPSA